MQGGTYLGKHQKLILLVAIAKCVFECINVLSTVNYICIKIRSIQISGFLWLKAVCKTSHIIWTQLGGVEATSSGPTRPMFFYNSERDIKRTWASRGLFFRASVGDVASDLWANFLTLTSLSSFTLSSSSPSAVTIMSAAASVSTFSADFRS